MFHHFEAWDGHEEVYAVEDSRAGLSVVVAIHNTKLGPALGGTRFWRYPAPEDAVNDALRLSRAMTYKSALAGVPVGGGKAVIMSGTDGAKSDSLLEAYGRLLNRIGDRFSTGEDVGFSIADCEKLRSFTPYVSGTASRGRGDPSRYTAVGVWHSLRAAAARMFGSTDLAGLRIAVQGLGGVGWRLCELLSADKAKLIVADVRAEKAEEAREAFGAEVVDPARIHAVAADIWSPCALGGVINDKIVAEIQARVIVGAANNQLSRVELAGALHSRGILLAPDIVVSAGGILSGADEAATVPGRSFRLDNTIEQRLERIGTRLTEVMDLAEDRGVTPTEAALQLAKEIVATAR